MEQHLNVLYEDNHLLAVCKAGGMLVQGDRTNDPTLLEYAKSYLKEKYSKPGNVFLGLVHRLDRPVSGVVLFARTSKAASRVTKMFKERRIEKVYAALVAGVPERAEGTLEDLLERRGKRSRIVSPEQGGRGVPALLRYRTLAHISGVTLLQIDPTTGRHHQIRVQLAHRGHPVAGDLLYGAAAPLPDKTIGLHAWRLTLTHPVTGAVVSVSAPPPATPHWDAFRDFFEK